MVVDVQCIMQALVSLAENFHTKIITTSPKVKLKGATHMEFEETNALTIAKDILKSAIDNFKNRPGSMAVVIDGDMERELVAGIYWLACAVGGTEVFDDYDHALKWLIRREFANTPPPGVAAFSGSAAAQG